MRHSPRPGLDYAAGIQYLSGAPGVGTPAATCDPVAWARVNGALPSALQRVAAHVRKPGGGREGDIGSGAGHVDDRGVVEFERGGEVDGVVAGARDLDEFLARAWAYCERVTGCDIGGVFKLRGTLVGQTAQALVEMVAFEPSGRRAG